MAYVRKKGNQVAIVHGHRDPDTGDVVQSTLFTFSSKAEALSAVGKGPNNQRAHFQNLIQAEYPGLKLDWAAISRGVLEHLDVLPDSGEYRDERLAASFKKSLWAFTREIVQTNTQFLAPPSKMLIEYKEQLEFLRDVIDMKLELIKVADVGEFEDNSEFHWDSALRGPEINPEVEEMASELYRCGDYDAAAAAFALLTGSFPSYAEGFNYLGLINLDRGQLDEAIANFHLTVESGRKLFPKRMRKEHYWTDHSTRPYMRGLRNLALALNRRKSYQDALAICDKLEDECNDNVTASVHRAAIFLNSKQWQQAEQSALSLITISPIEAAIAAFSQFEQGRLPEARQNFLFAALNNPLGIEMLIKGKAVNPKNFLQSEDYNGGIELRATLAPYLADRTAKSRAFFADILSHSQVKKLLAEVSRCAISHSELKDTTKHRANFARWHELQSVEFAKILVESMRAV